ncbi:MAG: adenine deaminase C-terminal domain-containing protein, partial [Candidatus Hadarchaeales archaeon]
SEVSEGKVTTRHLVEELEAIEGEVLPSVRKDIAKVAVVERHRATGNIGLGFVKGFGLERGAVASTVAHDSHNLLVMGVNDLDMAFAANKLIEVGGGMIAVSEGKVLALVELPIAGLMSEREAEEVSEEVAALKEAWAKLGCKMVSPFMTMSLLALPVLPELRITDKGLIDTVEFRRIPTLVQ